MKSYDLNNILKTTALVNKIINGEDSKAKIKLGYTMEIPMGEKTYVYEPYIVIDTRYSVFEKQNCLTLSDLMKCTHDKVHHNDVVYISDNTYSRDRKSKTCAEMKRTVLHMDSYIRFIEEDFKRECGFEDMEQVYAAFTKIREGIQDDRNLICEYLKAQDKELHDTTVGKCYYFPITARGANYYCETDE